MIFLVDKPCSFGSHLRNSAEQRQSVVLNLQFQCVQGDARQISSQNQSIIGFVDVDRGREDIAFDGLCLRRTTRLLF